MTAQTIKIDSAEVRVIRVSYVGELGYELHMPAYQLLSIYDSLFRVGTEYGLRDFGGYAMSSMRMEKAYRAYGHEFTEEVSALTPGWNALWIWTAILSGRKTCVNVRRTRRSAH
ncbi:MAG: hypothetical protein R3E89_19350 [Thiolinea sp.]